MNTTWGLKDLCPWGVHISRKLEQEAELGLKPRHSDMGCGGPKEDIKQLGQVPASYSFKKTPTYLEVISNIQKILRIVQRTHMYPLLKLTCYKYFVPFTLLLIIFPPIHLFII